MAANYKRELPNRGSLFDGWRDDVLADSPPVRFPIGSGDLARIEIGPGLVTLIGGAPASGKSAFVIEAVKQNSPLTTVVSGLREERVKGPRICHR